MPPGRMSIFCTIEITFNYPPVFFSLFFNLALKNVSAKTVCFLPNILQENSFCLMLVLLLGLALSVGCCVRVSSQSRTSSRCWAGRQKECSSQKKFREAESKRKDKISQTKPVMSNLTKQERRVLTHTKSQIPLVPHKRPVIKNKVTEEDQSEPNQWLQVWK